MWHHISSLALLKRMSAENSLSNLWRLLSRSHHRIIESVTIAAVQSECILGSWHCHLLNILRQLDLGFTIDLHQLVDTAQRGLPLTCNQMSSNTISCDLVTLLVERQDCLLVDIIGGGDHHVLEPVNLILDPHPLHGLPHHSAQVGQVTTVNADSNSFVTIVIESHGHGAEVEHSTLGNVVCINESHEAGGEGHGETDECSQFSIMSLTNK